MAAYQIYVMGVAGGPHKIGICNDVKLRLYHVRRDEGSQGIVLFETFELSQRKAIAAERYAHWLLREKQFRGEWFNVDLAEALNTVKTAIAADFSGIDILPPLTTPSMPRLPAGTLDRIDAVLDEGENRAAFIRGAIEKELKRRERKMVS